MNRSQCLTWNWEYCQKSVYEGYLFSWVILWVSWSHPVKRSSMVNSRWKHTRTDSGIFEQDSFMYASRHPLWMQWAIGTRTFRIQNNLCSTFLRKTSVWNENHIAQENKTNVRLCLTTEKVTGLKSLLVSQGISERRVLVWLDKQLGLPNAWMVLWGFTVWWSDCCDKPSIGWFKKGDLSLLLCGCSLSDFAIDRSWCALS